MQRILVLADRTGPCPGLHAFVRGSEALGHADAVVISTFPSAESHWLEEGLVERATERLEIPVHQYVLEHGATQAKAPA
jgi:hypothetical protein